LIIREGEELKAPRHASAAAPRDDYVTTRNIVPTVGNKVIIVGIVIIVELYYLSN